MGVPQAPWTGIGALQGEMSSIRSTLTSKVDRYELDTANRRMASLECTLGEIRTEIDGFLFRVQEMEQRTQEIADAINDHIQEVPHAKPSS